MSEWPRRPLFRKPKPRWPNPEESIGANYCLFDESKGIFCWEAVGLAKTTFQEEIFPSIRDRLSGYGDPASPKTNISVYLVGRIMREAQPLVMLICDDYGAACESRKLAEGCRALREHPEFATMAIDKAPNLTENRLMTVPGPNINVRDVAEGSQSKANSPYNVYQDPSATACGSKIYIRRDDICSFATGGGIIQGRDKYYYLTVAHAFLNSEFPSWNTPEHGTEGLQFETDSDFWMDEDFTEDMSLINTTSRGSISPEPDQSSSSDIAGSSASTTPLPYSVPEDVYSSMLSQDSVVARTESPPQPHDKANETLGTNHISPNAEKIGSLYHYSVEMDYALFELDCKRLETFNEIFPPGGSSTDTLVPLRVAQPDESLDVVAATGLSDTLSGWLSATPTYSIQPGTTDVQELWFVDLNGPLAVGDSGSWVVDAKTGDLLGQIVSGSPREGKVFITPAYKIFEDLELKTGQKFHLPPKPSAPTADMGQAKTPNMIDRDGQSPKLMKGPSLMSSTSEASHSSETSEEADKSGTSLKANDAAPGGSHDGYIRHEHYEAHIKRQRSKQDLATSQDMQESKRRRMSRIGGFSAMDDLPESEVNGRRPSIAASDHPDIVHGDELAKSTEAVPEKESSAGNYLDTLRSSTLEDIRPSAQGTPPPLDYIEDMMDFVYDNDHEYDEDDVLSYIPAPQQSQSISVYVDTMSPHEAILIKGVPANTTRQDMKNICAGIQGFEQLSIRKRNYNPVCLLRFTDQSSAEAALPDLLCRLEQHLQGVSNARLTNYSLLSLFTDLNWDAPEGSELTSREIRWPASPELSSSDGFATKAYNPITDSTRSEDSITSITSTTSSSSCVTTSSANTEYSVSFSNTVYERLDVGSAACAGAGVGAGVAGDRDARGHEDRM